MSEPLLRVRNLSMSLGEATVLDGVSLSVHPGEFVGLVGPNGAGKTTLLRAINGVHDVAAGSVVVDGDAQADCDTRAWSRRVATVPQDTSVTFPFRVVDVVEMGRTPHRRRTTIGQTETDRRRIEDALNQTSTTGLRERPIDELSGGERQRVFVARALAQDTPVLLLDEPTASLDINHQVEILGLVSDLVGEGRAALAAIHDLDLAARFCDRLALLHDGGLQAVGTPDEVLGSSVLDPAFQTSTAVSTDPVTGTPRVTARSPPPEDGRRVHVVGGGRVGARAIATLESAGHDVSAGVFREGDLAADTARRLNVPVVTTAPVGETTPAAIATAQEMADDAPVVVLADVTVGSRQWALDLAERAGGVVLLEARPLADRLQGSQRARGRYETIRDRGHVVERSALAETVTQLRRSIDRPADD